MRVGAIDCGTNSIRLLVADVDGYHLDEVVRDMTVVRLGEGVDRTGAFSQAALDRTFAACDAYAATIEDLGVKRLRFVATSASRDVSNREAFIDGVRARLGIAPEVISGAEEAGLSFRGAVEGLPVDRVAMPTLVVDIGGGSTEFVLGDRGLTIDVEAAVSVNIGCVRMTERHLHGDPPSPQEIARVEADVAAALDEAAAAVPLDRARSLVGVAGTVTTLVALIHGLPVYDPAQIHGREATLAQIDEVTERLLVMPRAERAELPVMHPGRVDVIGGGALVLRAIMRRTGLPVIASETDILDGVARVLAEHSA
ncbi:MAG: Ppx/GppA family phosphatase [Actinobacteria bacterium]|nr:Ppx/GppA family phosphatase [Actinomycetota bacterium]